MTDNITEVNFQQLVDLTNKAIEAEKKSMDDYNVLVDPVYVRFAEQLIQSFLREGAEVTQLTDGTVLVTRLQYVTYTYRYDANKGFVRATQSRPKKNRPSNLKKEEDSFEQGLEEQDEMAYTDEVAA